jgi:hypothetical protein
MYKRKNKGVPLVTWCLMFACVFMVSAWLGAKDEPKKYPVSQTIDEWIRHDRGMEYIKSRLKLTDLPAKEVTFITDSIITPLQLAIGSQVNPVIQAENKRFQDSIDKQKVKPKN